MDFAVVRSTCTIDGTAPRPSDRTADNKQSTNTVVSYVNKIGFSVAKQLWQHSAKIKLYHTDLLDRYNT